jgi:hypothetical protein
MLLVEDCRKGAWRAPRNTRIAEAAVYDPRAASERGRIYEWEGVPSRKKYDYFTSSP